MDDSFNSAFNFLITRSYSSYFPASGVNVEVFPKIVEVEEVFLTLLLLLVGKGIELAVAILEMDSLSDMS